jgi:acetyl/propionyl-CoA carboxylase alpha subunit
MFKKLLIANRGEIAVRIVRVCRLMGIQTVALYEPIERESLHVRLADECYPLPSELGFMDQQAILQIADQSGAQAIHPGYGFLAEQADFIRLCDTAGIVFIGPPTEIVEAARQKIDAIHLAQAHGFPVVEHSDEIFGETDLESLQAQATKLGFPLVVKSYRGGRGRGERLVRNPQHLTEAVRLAQAEAQAVYGDRRVYLEKAILPAHQVGIQILGDQHGNLLQLGDREGSIISGNQKIIEEAPAPCLNDEQRKELQQTALELGRMFKFQNAGKVEFLVDREGHYYFTEIKARIQMEHPLTEMITGVDMIEQQIRVAAGEPLSLRQDQVTFHGWALQCRVTAEDPLNNYLPSPGRVTQVRFPSGTGVRLETFVYPGSEVSGAYDPLLAKLITWGDSRGSAIDRMRTALDEFFVLGPATNLPLLQRILSNAQFVAGFYDTSFLNHFSPEYSAEDQFDTEQAADTYLRDLAVIAAVNYLRQNQSYTSEVPGQFLSGWHQDSRRLPE